MDVLRAEECLLPLLCSRERRNVGGKWLKMELSLWRKRFL